MENEKNLLFLRQSKLISLPILKVEDKSGYVRKVGSSFHDSYILGKDGGLHYYNLQSDEGTEFGGYKFLVDKDPYDCMDYFDTVNFLQLMEIDAERLKIQNNEKYLKLKKELNDLFKDVLQRRDEVFEKNMRKALERAKKESEE